MDAAPPRPTATGALVTDGVACAGDPFNMVLATAATIITDNAVVRRTIISPPSVRHYDQSPDDYAPVSPGAQGRVSVPATIIGTAVPGRKVTNASGVSKVRWWHRDLSPAPTSQAVNTGRADRAESVDGRALRSSAGPRRQLPDVCPREDG